MNLQFMSASNNVNHYHHQKEDCIEINRICRCCLIERSNMKSIFDTFLPDMLMSCANITINETDGLPHRICFQCVQQVTGSYTFRQQCERSNSMLQHWLNNPINADLSVSPTRLSKESASSLESPSQSMVASSMVTADAVGTPIESNNNNLINDSENCNPSGIKIINVLLQCVENDNNENILIPIDDTNKIQLLDTVFMTNHQQVVNDPIEIDINTSNSFINDKSEEEHHQRQQLQQQEQTDHLILLPVTEQNIQTDQSPSMDCGIVHNDDDGDGGGGDTESQTSDIDNQYQDSLEIDICNVSDNENDQLIMNNGEISLIPNAYVELMNSFIVTPSNNMNDNDLSESHQEKQQDHQNEQSPQQIIGVCIKNKQTSNENFNLIQPTNLIVCLLCRKEFEDEILFVEHQKCHQLNLIIDASGEEEQQQEQKEPQHNQQLQKPTKRLTDKIDYKCKHCDRIFSESSYLKKHLKRHNGQRNFACTICRATFFESSVLKVHMRIHTGEKPYKCEICNKMFAQSNQLKSHSFIHQENRQYICDICDKSFNLKNQLDIHRRIHTGHRPYTCEFCDRKFTQSGNLAIHLRTHTGDKPYSCTICNKNFSTSFQFKIHSQKHSNVQQKNDHRSRSIPCAQCKKMFFNKADLGVHMRMHTNERPYGCKICEKKFRMNSHLVIHMRKHTGETPFKCTVCLKEFTTGAVLKKHLLIHSGEKNYACIHCGKTFTQPSTRNTHQKTHLKKK